MTSNFDLRDFNYIFINRNNGNYILSLGKAIVEFCQVIPDGLLIFFPSYGLMEECMQRWLEFHIIDRIKEKKLIFVESQTKNEFDKAKKSYNDCIDIKKEAVFMAALRGKVSEGLDFADMYGRAVIIVGIPYANCADVKLKMKQKYLDKKKASDKKMISGDDWYKLDAIRAVNQAIGRVIRHVDDYGAILFCDERFAFESTQEYISSWVKSQICTTDLNCSIRATAEQLKDFYVECEKTVFHGLKVRYYWKIYMFLFVCNFSYQNQNQNLYQKMI